MTWSSFKCPECGRSRSIAVYDGNFKCFCGVEVEQIGTVKSGAFHPTAIKRLKKTKELVNCQAKNLSLKSCEERGAKIYWNSSVLTDDEIKALNDGIYGQRIIDALGDSTWS